MGRDTNACAVSAACQSLPWQCPVTGIRQGVRLSLLYMAGYARFSARREPTPGSPSQRGAAPRGARGQQTHHSVRSRSQQMGDPYTVRSRN